MLSINRITVKFGELTILRSLSLEVADKTIVGLVGRNGAGKTTTFKSIMGFVPIVSGEIRLNDQDILSFPPRHRIRLGIGYMPEDRRLIGQLTVRENLLLPIWTQGQKDDQELLETIYNLMPEVKKIASQRASQLSGGQQKLVAMARSLLTSRKLLLLDEPMEGIAFALATKMAEAIKSFQEREPDLTILVAESDLNRMRLLTENIYTIERGEIVQGR